MEMVRYLRWRMRTKAVKPTIGCTHFSRKGITHMRMVSGSDDKAVCTKCNDSFTVNSHSRAAILQSTK